MRRFPCWVKSSSLALLTLIVVQGAGCGDDGYKLIPGRYAIAGSIAVSDGCTLGLPANASLQGAAIDLSWNGAALRTKVTTDAKDDPGQWFDFEFTEGDDDLDGYENHQTGTVSYGSTAGCTANSTQNRFVTVINDREFHFKGFVEFVPVPKACGTASSCQTHYEARFTKI